MKKQLLLLFTFLLLFSSLIFAGNTTVTATITGSDGQVWNNGSYIITFRPTPGVPGPYTVGGVAFNQGPFTGSLSSIGALSITLTDNLTVQPAGSQWTISVCPNATAQCNSVNITVTGASQSLSTQLSGGTISIKAPPIPKAYLDAEVAATPGYGAVYYNVTGLGLKCWNGTTWDACGNGTGSGGPGSGLSPGWTNADPTSPLVWTADGVHVFYTNKWQIGSNHGFEFPEIAAPLVANLGAGSASVYVDSTTHQLSCLLKSGSDCFPAGVTTNPAAPATSVQFNDGGTFGGNSGLLFVKDTQTLILGGKLDNDANTSCTSDHCTPRFGSVTGGVPNYGFYETGVGLSETASKANTLILQTGTAAGSPPSLSVNAGIYLVSIYVNSYGTCNTPGPAVVKVGLTWKGPIIGETHTLNVPLMVNGASTFVTTGVPLGDFVGGLTQYGYASVPLAVLTTGDNSAIEYSTTLVACTVGTAQYQLHITTQKLN